MHVQKNTRNFVKVGIEKENAFDIAIITVKVVLPFWDPDLQKVF